VVTDPTAAHRSAAAAAALPAADAAALDEAWAAFAARQPRSRFGVGYRKMVWFWTFGVLADARLARYRYLWRLDTDSEMLAPLRVDLFAQLAAQRRVMGYHCWTYESPPVARGFTAAAGAAAAAAGALPPAWAGYAPQGAGADAPAGMIYNNFSACHQLRAGLVEPSPRVLTRYPHRCVQWCWTWRSLASRRAPPRRACWRRCCRACCRTAGATRWRGARCWGCSPTSRSRGTWTR
jgi:hypothetical protein